MLDDIDEIYKRRPKLMELEEYTGSPLKRIYFVYNKGDKEVIIKLMKNLYDEILRKVLFDKKSEIYERHNCKCCCIDGKVKLKVELEKDPRLKIHRYSMYINLYINKKLIQKEFKKIEFKIIY